MNQSMSLIRRLVDIPVTDPDDARRRRLLNVMLLCVVSFTLIETLVSLLVIATGAMAPPRNIVLAYLSLPGAVLMAGALYAINRYASGTLAASLFLLLVTISIFANPEAATSGQGLLAFAIPIVLASFLLRPYASFLMASLVSLLVSAVRIGIFHIEPGIALVPTFFLTALVSWIGARGMERALAELRILNRELDQRVIERTQELAAALAREQAEASKNQAILDSTADGVIVFDTAGKAVVANPAIADLLGHPVHRITGRSIDALMGEDVDPADRDKVIHLLGDREHTHSGIQFRWGRKTFAVSLAPVRDDSGRVAGTVAVFRDFTREAEIDRMKSVFISIASHELRTPLSGILGYIDMLQAGVYGELTEQQRNVLGRVVANTGQLLSLANNLLDRAQIEAGRLTLNISAFSPRELVTSVQGVMDVIAHAKGLKLTSQIADGVPETLIGDRQRLHQILINLVGNAIKFTSKGSVDIRVSMHDSNRWALTVSDTGRGIPPEAKTYIFDAFRQADDPATREYGGAGLGLSIVKQLVNLMGGEITVESELGHGSTFTVVLPCAVEEVLADPGAAAGGAA